MLEKAIEKIKAEMDGNKADPYVYVMGEFLLNQLTLNPEASEKVLLDGKTIKGSMKELEKIAKGKAVNGCGMISDQEGYGIVLKYFGIRATGPVVAPIPTEAKQIIIAPSVQEKKPSVDFNVELDF